jgi:hypothetical protein
MSQLLNLRFKYTCNTYFKFIMVNYILGLTMENIIGNEKIKGVPK